MLVTLVVILLVGLVVSAGAGFYVYRQKQIEDQAKLEWLRARELVTLLIHVPRDNDRPASAAEQVFASLHGVFKREALVQEELSFEIVATEGITRFFVVIPAYLREFVEGQLYAQYPNIHITQVEDYVGQTDLDGRSFVGTEMALDKADVYPIKTYDSFEVDPLAGITSVLSSIAAGEEIWIQMIVRPEDEKWQERGVKIVEDIRAGKKAAQGFDIVKFFKNLFKVTFKLLLEVAKAMVSSKGETVTSGASAEKASLSAPVEEALKGIERKITKLGYATKLRVVAIAPDIKKAEANLSATIGAYTQYNTNNLNNIRSGQLVENDAAFWQLYWARLFLDSGSVLNITELASLFHFPSISVETPNIVWAGARKSEPPANLPTVEDVPSNELTVLGITDFRSQKEKFGIKIKDRLRHMYVIGKSGTGKSTLLENMILDDVRENRGVIVVDPHGELVDHVIDEIPDHRIEDTILVDPADREYPIGINLLETVDDDLKGIVASGFVGILEKIFGNSWGPRLEYILRNAVLALLDTPNTTMLGIPKMLVEKKYRMDVVKNIKDPVVRDFWENEFEQYDPKFRTEAVAPIQNKVGQFLSTPTIRNIVGQVRSTVDIREVMDNEKILLINLSKGKIGEDNSALLGAMLITKVQLAAMSRANLTPEERKNSFLYVDEFQNFATQSFATILSEARKYALSLTMANQYIAQMEEVVREAVFGNVGSLISFRVGAGDAPFLAKEFAPVFDENDIVNLDLHHIYLKMSIDGMTAQAFSALTLPPIYNHTGHAQKIRELTRGRYGVKRAQVEKEIADWSESTSPRVVLSPAQQRALGATAGELPKSALNGVMPVVTSFEAASAASKPAAVSAPVSESALPLQPAIKDSKLEAIPASEQKPAVKKEETAVEVIEPKRRDKPLPKNLIKGLHYKEVARRGGEKWYFGVPYYLADGTPAGDFSPPQLVNSKAANSNKLPLRDPKPVKVGVGSAELQPVVKKEKREVLPAAAEDELRKAIQEVGRSRAASKTALAPKEAVTEEMVPVVADKPKETTKTASKHKTDWKKLPMDQPVKL